MPLKMKRAMYFHVISLIAVTSSCGADISETGTGEDDLTQAGKKLVGAYIEQGVGTFRGLVLTPEAASANANRFFADVDTGIVCIQAPCPTVQRIEGTFTAGTKYITLKSETASELTKQVLGKYRYKVAGDKFSLWRTGFEQSLEEVDSYCSASSVATDCEAQGLIHPQCAGPGWTCSASALCEWSCEDRDCADGTVVSGPDSFVSSTDGMECKIPSSHCVTKDPWACPQLSPPPPNWCAGGTVVSGAGSFTSSADGKECKMPSLHCVTKDSGACPQLSPLPPNWCADGTVVSGPSSFIPSADGKECKMPSVHCLTNDLDACSQ